MRVGGGGCSDIKQVALPLFNQFTIYPVARVTQVSLGTFCLFGGELPTKSLIIHKILFRIIQSWL